MSERVNLYFHGLDDRILSIVSDIRGKLPHDRVKLWFSTSQYQNASDNIRKKICQIRDKTFVDENNDVDNALFFFSM